MGYENNTYVNETIAGFVSKRHANCTATNGEHENDISISQVRQIHL